MFTTFGISMKRCVWVKFSIKHCREIASGPTTFLWLLHFLTLTSASLFLPLEEYWNFNVTKTQEAKIFITPFFFQKVFLWRCSAVLCWIMLLIDRTVYCCLQIAFFFAVTKKGSFSGNVLQNMHVNDDHWIALSFLTTLFVSKSKWQNLPTGIYPLFSAWAMISINQHLPLRVQKIPTDKYLHFKPVCLNQW